MQTIAIMLYVWSHFPFCSPGPRYEVEVRWSQRELERGKKVAYSKSYFVERRGQEGGGGLERVCTTAFQNDITRM